MTLRRAVAQGRYGRGRRWTPTVLAVLLLGMVTGCAAIKRFLVPPAETRAAGTMAQKQETIRSAEVVLLAASVEGVPAATAVALQGDRVLAVGPADDVTPWVGAATTVLRIRGGHIAHALVDAHVQLETAAMREDAADLREVKSAADLARATRAAQSIMGDWLWGHGLAGDVADRLTPESIEAALPDVPAWLSRADDRGAWLTPALARLLPSDLGRAVQASGGRVDGLLAERAWRALPPLRPARLRPLVRRLLLGLVQKGVAEVHAMGSSAALAEAVGYLDLMGQLPLRVRIYYDVERPEAAELLAGRALPLHGTMATVAGVHVRLDGTLAARTAALSAPYADSPTQQGVLRYDDAALRDLIDGADGQRVQVAVHAAGDLAVTQILRVLDGMRRPAGAWPVRVEHPEVVSDGQLVSLRERGVACCIQPRRLPADSAVVLARLGATRMPWAMRGLGLGRWCALRAGSEMPQLSIDPLADWRALLQTPPAQLAADATPGDVAQAAWAVVTGRAGPPTQPSLRAGVRADLTVWSADPTFAAAPAQLLWTVIAGSPQAHVVGK